MMNSKAVRLLCACTLGSLCTASPSNADLRRAGDTFSVLAAPSRGSAVAYDPRNNLYLVVSSQGTLRGRYVTASGTPYGDSFVIQASGNYTHFPRVAYSPDANGGAGGFLVTWHESDQPGGSTSVHGRIAVLPGAFVSGDVILGNDKSWWEAGPAVAYATGSREFLVVWRGRFGSANDITAARVNNSGQLIANFQVTATGAYEDNASVAYNPQTDEFLVSYAAYTTFASVASQRVQAGTGQLLGPPVVLVQTGGTYITDTSYNQQTNQFLVAWYQLPAANVSGRLVASGGAVQGNVVLLSSRYRANDALSVAYNSVSTSFLLVSHDPLTVENGGVHLNGAAVPENSGVQLTGSGGTGNFYPRLAANGNAPEWLMSTARSFTQTVAQRLQTDAGAGGAPAPAPTPPTTPPPTAPNPRMVIDIPRTGASVSGGFTVAGWAADLGSGSGTGVDAVHIWAYPTSGAAPMFVGAASLGVSRPDVGAAFGDARFGSSGFTLTGTLPGGTYDLAVFAHSTVTGTFNNSAAARVTVVAPQSIPRMAIDMPAANQMVSQNFRVAGWALDLASSSGTGIDSVVVWAYPVSGAAPVLVGVATIELSRPDVGAAFGGARFTPGGFNLTVSGTLSPGEYNLVVYAHSTITGTFNNASMIHIRVL